MKKLLVLTAIALGIGLAAGFWIGNAGDNGNLDKRFLEKRPVQASMRIPAISAAEAEASRRDGYRDIDSIAEAMALPTPFARKEAVFVLAGRSESAELQDLLFQAVAVNDAGERGNVIRTLLERLVEIDPKSAIAIAESPAVTEIGHYSQQTWFLWAKHDLEAAFEEATTRKRDTVRIAQALYTAMPIPDLETKKRIQAAMGHRPNRQTISFWARSIYRQSPLEAAAFVNGLANRNEQHGAVQSMAYYLAQSPQGEATQFAGMLNSAELQRSFKNILNAQIASNDPVRALQMVLSGQTSKRNTAAVGSAVRHLVATDPGQLDAIISQLTEREQQIALSVAASTMAESDHDRALQWLAARTEPAARGAINDVLVIIARKDPERAVSEALKLPRRANRNGAIGAIATAVLVDDPVRAMAVLDKISEPHDQSMYFRQVMSSWMRRDADSAIAWYNSQPEHERDVAIGDIVEQLAWNQPDTAARILPRLSPEDARIARAGVAVALERNEGFDASLAFIKQFANEPDYPELKLQLYLNLAQQEPNRALRVVQQETDRATRDKALTSVAGSIAYSDPGQALAIANQIESQADRVLAHSNIVQSWMGMNSDAALNWISSQPPGAQRDQLLATAAYQSAQKDSTQITRILEQIADSTLRQSTARNVAQHVYIQSPEIARQLLREANIDDAERAALEKQFEQIKAQRGRHVIYSYSQ